MAKMSFLAEKYTAESKENKVENKLAKSGHRMGVVKQPTGTGKSAVIFEDIIYNIQNRRKKTVFVICSHILNLNEQTFGDFFELNTFTHFLDNLKTCVILNSSVDSKNYENMTYNSRTNIENNIGILENFASSEYDIAFVSSCNESFEKFVNCKIDKNVDVICYIDECHTLIAKIKNGEINMIKLAQKCYKLYGLSATPSEFVKYLNIANNKLTKSRLAESECIVDMSPEEAINNNIIIKPFVKTAHTTDGQITSNVIIKAMEDAIESKSAPIHKMLVTLARKADVNRLYDECSAAGYKCFKNISEPDCEAIADFCDDVENCKEHCIIFHCRKLIQGIDIRSITDAIISNNSNTDAEDNIRIIQIIGRAIRTANNERGLDINDRQKKFANIYFVSNGNIDYDKAIARIVIKYYGLNNIIIENNENNVNGYNPLKHLLDESNNHKNKKNNAFLQIKLDIEELKVNYKKYIEDNIISLYKSIVNEGGVCPIDVLLNNIQWGNLSDDRTTIEMFNESEQLEALRQVFKNNNIEI